MNVIHAVILMVGLALVCGATGLFAAGLVSNRFGEANAAGVRVSFSSATAVLLLTGSGLLALSKIAGTQDGLTGLPPASAGIPASNYSSQPYTGAVIPPANSIEQWLLNTSGAFRLEMFSLGGQPLELVGGMDLFPLQPGQYQFFLDIHPDMSAGINDALVGSGILYQEQDQWYMVFEQGSPAIEVTGSAVPVGLERQGRFLVLQFEDSAGRTFRQTWRQI